MFSPLNNDFFCRRNGVEIATLFDQNHVDNHKNSMAGQSILAELEEGDRIQVKHFNKINGRNNILNGSRTFFKLTKPINIEKSIFFTDVFGGN